MLYPKLPPPQLLYKPTQHVVDGGLNLLDTRDVVRVHHHRMVREPLAHDPPPIVAHDAYRKQTSLAGLREGGKYVARTPAGGDPDRNVLRSGMGDELAGEDGLAADVVGYSRDVGWLGG